MGESGLGKSLGFGNIIGFSATVGFSVNTGFLAGNGGFVICVPSVLSSATFSCVSVASSVCFMDLSLSSLGDLAFSSLLGELTGDRFFGDDVGDLPGVVVT